MRAGQPFIVWCVSALRERTNITLMGRGGGCIAQREHSCFSPNNPTVQSSGFPKIYFDVAEIYRRHCLEESGQRFENVDRSYLVLARGKLVLQKRTLAVLPERTTTGLNKKSR